VKICDISRNVGECGGFVLETRVSVSINLRMYFHLSLLDLHFILYIHIAFYNI
jgi:hypothetical protein